MWFDEIMDDFKKALYIANNYKAIFVPVFIKLGLLIAFVTYCIVTLIIYIKKFPMLI